LLEERGALSNSSVVGVRVSTCSNAAVTNAASSFTWADSERASSRPCLRTRSAVDERQRLLRDDRLLALVALDHGGAVEDRQNSICFSAALWK